MMVALKTLPEAEKEALHLLGGGKAEHCAAVGSLLEVFKDAALGGVSSGSPPFVQQTPNVELATVSQNGVLMVIARVPSTDGALLILTLMRTYVGGPQRNIAVNDAIARLKASGWWI